MAEQDAMAAHEQWMRICLQLGREALQSGNPPVGALVVKDQVPVGREKEATRTKGDITCHAEIEAVRDALGGNLLSDLSGCTLYTTHEPCLMCAYVIRHYRVSCLVCGITVPAVGGFSSPYPVLTASDIPIWPPPPLLVQGVLEEDCRALTVAYEQQRKSQREMVIVHYPPGSKKISIWQERLERMALKHDLIRQEKLTQPLLRYGEEVVEGEGAIEAYLDELEELVRTWYECRCDKYEF